MYSAMAFKLPINVCDNIDRICNKFLWSGDAEKRKITLVSWNYVFMGKRKGGGSKEKEAC